MLKELEDYDGFPKALRRWQMDFIGTAVVWAKIYKPLTPMLQELLASNNCKTIQDLCSGSGVPAIYLQQHIKSGVPLLLTDKYPYTAFTNQADVRYATNSIDVTALQPQQYIGYTMFNAFHHFSSAQQVAIVQKMVSARASFLFAEILEPTIFVAIKIVITTTVLQWLAAPFIKPFSLSRLFFTCIIPVNLVTVTYDGIVSILKSKTVKQYNDLVSGLAADNYTITVQKVKTVGGNIVYIKGSTIN
jgi:hypothetical protein